MEIWTVCLEPSVGVLRLVDPAISFFASSPRFSLGPLPVIGQGMLRLAWFPDAPFSPLL